MHCNIDTLYGFTTVLFDIDCGIVPLFGHRIMLAILISWREHNGDLKKKSLESTLMCIPP